MIDDDTSPKDITRVHLSLFAFFFFFFFQAEDGIRDDLVTGVQTCALPISPHSAWTRVFLLFWASRLDASTQQSTRGQTTPRHPCDARSYPGCSAPLPKRAWRYPVPSPSGKRSCRS